MRHLASTAFVVSFALVSAGCGDECEPGSGNCACTDEGTCFSGFMCVADRCEVEAEVDAGGTDAAVGDDAGQDAGEADGGGESCVDFDLDGRGEGCASGPDCDDNDRWNWVRCDTCADEDGDFWYVDCDSYGFGHTGPDADDENFNVHTETALASCVDEDFDEVFVGCDWYSEDMPGPDCDDANPAVGTLPADEICNGLSETCSGEIDARMPSEMCPMGGIPVPNVALQDGWACAPPSPGEDGCRIKNCQEGWFDQDGDPSNGCECAGRPMDCL